MPELGIIKNCCMHCRRLSNWSEKFLRMSVFEKELKIRQIGDPILRAYSKPIEQGSLMTPQFKDLVDNLLTAMKKTNGAGIAAPQIGYSLQVIALEVTGNDLKKAMEKYGSKGVSKMEMTLFPLKVLINPKIEIIDPTVVNFKEACLSVNGFSGVVPRARQIKVNALNMKGEHINFDAYGWTARIIQHEVDHLRGNLFVDSMLYKSLVNEGWRNYID